MARAPGAKYHGAALPLHIQLVVAMPKKRRKGSKAPADIHAWIEEQPSDRRRPLRTALGSLRKTYRLQQTTDVLWWHEFGVLLKEFFLDVGHYGSSVTELLAKELAEDGDPAGRATNTIWQARIIAKNFSEAEAKSWSKKTR